MSNCLVHFLDDNSWTITENLKELKVDQKMKFKYIIDKKAKWFDGVVKHVGNKK